jgi:hypothetical protein
MMERAPVTKVKARKMKSVPNNHEENCG